MKTSSVAVDTAVFVVPMSQVEISPDFEAELVLPKINTATGENRCSFPLWVDTAGRRIEGVRGELNTDDFQVTVKPPKFVSAAGPAAGALAYIQCSAGMNSETNLLPLDCEALLENSLWLRAKLASLGFKISEPLERAKLGRLDIATNVQLSEPVANYAPLFRAAGAAKTQSKSDFGGTGFTVGNKKRDRWVLNFYDKAAEMEAKDYPLHLRPVNTLRPELRLLKSKLICERLGLPEPTLRAVRSNWPALAAAHSEAVRKQLFRHPLEAGKPSPFDYLALARGAVVSAPNRSLATFASSANFCSLVRDWGLEAARDLLYSELASGSGDTAKHQRARIDKELDKAAHRLALWESSPSGTPMMALYRELESKLLA
jgi:hypothetical protein